MQNEWKKAFGQMKAEEALKESTIAFLQGKLEEKKPKSSLFFRMAATCCTLLLVTGIALGGLYFRVDSYINMDVNPSIELGINLFGRVISAKGWNDGGEALTALTDVSHKGYQEAIKLLADSPALKAYTKKDALMVLTVVGENSSMLEALTTVDTGMETDYNSCTTQDAQNAQDQGVSPGRYGIFTQIQALQPEFSAADCMSMSMRALRQRLQQMQNGEEVPSTQGGTEGSGQGNGQGSGQGNGQGSGQGNGQNSGQGNGQGKKNASKQGKGRW